jgi:hypothetical protein
MTGGAAERVRHICVCTQFEDALAAMDVAPRWLCPRRNRSGVKMSWRLATNV